MKIMKTHIVICNDFGSINGGAAKVAITSAIGLSKKGFEVTYFCGVGPVDPELQKNVKEVICLNLDDILNNPSRIKAVCQGIWNRKAEMAMDNLLKRLGKNTIVHIHGWTKSLTASVVEACKKNNIDPFISIHDYFAACPNGGFYNYKKGEICKYRGVCVQCLLSNCDSRNYPYKLWRFFRQLVQDRYIRNSDKIVYIGTSKFSYNAIKDSLTRTRVKWVRNPITVYSGPMVECFKNEAFLFVCHISQHKGTDLFCEAIKKTKNKGIVVGAGNELEEYKRKYPEIDFVGWKKTDELKEYVKKSKALVVSSRYYEGSPLIVPEMQCYGLPCIVPDRCAASDTINDGVNGLIFKSGDCESLCDAINRMNTEKRESTLFHPETWNNSYVTLDMHISELIKAYGVTEQ